MYVPCDIEHPNGTVTTVTAMRVPGCRRWPWVYRKLANGAKVPVEYDTSIEAEIQRRPEPFTYICMRGVEC